MKCCWRDFWAHLELQFYAGNIPACLITIKTELVQFETTILHWPHICKLLTSKRRLILPRTKHVYWMCSSRSSKGQKGDLFRVNIQSDKYSLMRRQRIWKLQSSWTVAKTLFLYIFIVNYKYRQQKRTFWNSIANSRPQGQLPLGDDHPDVFSLH